MPQMLSLVQPMAAYSLTASLLQIDRIVEVGAVDTVPIIAVVINLNGRLLLDLSFLRRSLWNAVLVNAVSVLLCEGNCCQ